MIKPASAEADPIVGIIMGSDSDLPVMKHVGRALDQLNLAEPIPYEERVISAHRTPARMVEYARTARGRGLQVIVALAGGSAHLQGMTASETTLPVLGVAITSNPDVLNRALGSMIGLPEGKPLASFQGKEGAFNAGLLAARILSLARPDITAALEEYDAKLAATVEAKDVELHALGAEGYEAQRAIEAAAAVVAPDDYYIQ